MKEEFGFSGKTFLHWQVYGLRNKTFPDVSTCKSEFSTWLLAAVHVHFTPLMDVCSHLILSVWHEYVGKHPNT